VSAAAYYPGLSQNVADVLLALGILALLVLAIRALAWILATVSLVTLLTARALIRLHRRRMAVVRRAA